MSQQTYTNGGAGQKAPPPSDPTPIRNGEEREYETIETEKIAIIGLAGRFPGAQTIDQFWQNLCAGVEARSTFTDACLAPHVAPDLRQDAAYVKAGFMLDQVDQFDAAFFDFTPRQAQITDPQQRLFLECAWEALEVAGIDVATTDQLIGLYAGASQSSYAANDPRYLQRSMIDGLQFLIGNDKDYLATQTAYRLNLQGPCMTIQSACSTGLVAAHVGCQSLLNRECDVALAGAVTVRLPQERGYLYEEGGILAADGHCRTFDAAATGTVFGNGVGVVVLKRLSAALADGDFIWAIIRGSSVNNDGSRKFNFSTSSQLGQFEVISEAWSVADVTPAEITYLETHGTGTQVGDPIEVETLVSLFADAGSTEKFCAIGAVKPNVGHLETAAGITGLIKTVLALHHRQIPPTINFTTLNPEIDLAGTPLYINQTLQPWTTDRLPRRAGVSSFGIGGANAHLVLEEAPLRPAAAPAPSQPYQLLTISAKSAGALRALAARYADFLATADGAELTEICYTSYVGRSHFAHRLSVVGASPPQLHAALAAYQTGAPTADARFSQGVVATPPTARPIAFLFTGQGSQYVGMGRELYATQPTFRAVMDRCDQLLHKHLGLSILRVLYPDITGGAAKTGDQAGAPSLDETTFTQPALFALEVALATLWQSWGIQPDLLLGHSVGELAAACVAGVFSLEDGLRLIAARGRLMGALPQDGAMVALFTDEARVRTALAPYAQTVAVAAINGPAHIVISGQRAAVLTIAEGLAAEGVKMRPLNVSHAFHSPLMEPILAEFRQVAARVTYHQPKVRLIANRTGKVAGPELATPDYWVRHLREPVRFVDGVTTLYAQASPICLEIGPKPTLIGLVGQLNLHAVGGAPTLLPTLRQGHADWQQLLTTLGALYVHGLKIDWPAFVQPYAGRKCVLPTYPFQRKSYWLPHQLSQPVTQGENPVQADLSTTSPAAPYQPPAQRPLSSQAQARGATAPPPETPSEPSALEARFTAANPIDLPGLLQSLQQLSQQHGSEIHLHIDAITLQGLHLQITPGAPAAAQSAVKLAAPPPAAAAAPLVPKRQLSPVAAVATMPAPVLHQPPTVAGDHGQSGPAGAETPVPATHAAQSMPDFAAVLTTLRQLVANILYLEDASAMSDADKFIDHGMDSVTGVAFINKINRTFDLKLKAVMLYDYATLSEMAAYILALLQEKAIPPAGNGAPIANGAAVVVAEQPHLRDLLNKVAKRELTPQASRLQLDQLAGSPQGNVAAMPTTGVLDHVQLMKVIRQQLAEIQPEFAERPLDLTATFDELGFDSAEQAEIIVKTMERLGLEMPRIDFAYAKTIGAVVEKIMLNTHA